MMVPSGPHDPPRISLAAAQTTIGGPPDASIFLSSPPAKNARERLSGDQNGEDASSVPRSTRGAKVPSDRIQRNARPWAFLATNATSRPFGDTAIGTGGLTVSEPGSASAHPSGSVMTNRVVCA